jgi:hypothetical protein
LAARQIMRRVVRIPAAAYAAVTYLWDTLDGLNPWHHAAVHNGSEAEHDGNHSDPNSLFPHL